MQKETENMISVVIIEDHPIFRDALRAHLETRPDRFNIIGAVGTRAEGLKLIEEQPPDIVLLDLGLPEHTEDGLEEGLETIQDIWVKSQSSKVVVLTAYRRSDAVFKAIKAGAVTYLLKDHFTGEEVINALERVYRGDPPIDHEIASKLWKFFQNPEAADFSPLGSLTGREMEVLQLIADRKKNHEVAESLTISPSTVKKHVSNILSKLQLQSRSELIVYYHTNRTNPQVDTPPDTPPDTPA